MIDDLATRVTLALAAFAILAAGTLLMRLMAYDSLDDAAQDLAQHVARGLDAIGRTGGSVRIEVGTKNGGALTLPGDLVGRSYHLEIRSTVALVVVDSIVRGAAFQSRIHPFEPQAEMTAGELARLDGSVVIIVPGRDTLVVESTVVSVDGLPLVATFAYLPD